MTPGLLAQVGDGAPISPFSGLLLAAGAIVLLVWSFASLRRRIRKSEAAPTATERLDEIRTRQRSRDSLDDMMVSAEELTRRLAAHLDNKAMRLEALLDEAKATIDRLESLSSAAAERGGASDGVTAPDPIVRNIYRLADEGRAPLEIAQALDEQVGKVELVLALREA